MQQARTEALTWRGTPILMELSSKAKAIAEFDAICDEFERTYQCDETTVGGDDAFLKPWLNRVSPDLRNRLKDELIALRMELQNGRAQNRELVQRLPAQADVDDEVWQAIIDCQTFQPLSLEAKIALAERISMCEFDRGSLLLRHGAKSPGLHLITAGTVSVMAPAGEQKSRELDRDGTGSVLGEMSMITGHPCAADVVATTDVRALVLPVQAYPELQSRHPEIEIALSQLVSDRLGHRTQDALCGKSLGGYRLQRCIGGGAMGVLYAAENESDCSLRALKMLRHRFIYSPQIVSRFDQEAELLSQLEHPNIVSLQDHFVAYRTRFIVLDLYDGADLREVLRRNGPLSEAMAKGVLGQIAAGLRYAHQRGIVHLDLKPANVLLNQQGHVAITDFGLSQLVASDGCDQEIAGTPLYMPPEQFSNTDLGVHCDWYSFACLAYELLSGERLFQGGDVSELMDQKLQVPSSSWPTMNASDTFRRHIAGALHPLADHRTLDLKEIASWAHVAPELAQVQDAT